MSMDLLFSEPISKLSDAVIYAARTTANFKTQLQQIKNTLDRITPIIVEIQNQNLKLHRTNSEQVMFIDELEIANKLVHKCSTIKNWNLYLKFTHSLKLKDVDQKLLRFFGIEVQAVQLRKITETLAEVIEVNERLTKHMGYQGGSMTVSSGGDQHVKQRGSIERKRLGWPVPSLPRDIVGFDEPLKELKAKVLSDVAGKVVVVSAAGGSGKTTMVKMLCNDPQIQDHFGENVFFVTISETPDFMPSVNDLFNPNCFDQQVKFQGNEDAKNKLENFLRDKVSGPVLLVIDDVWDESYIKNFEFDIKGYKLLVTSRKIFTKYYVFKFDPLSDEDAKVLFRKSARPVPTIDENLIDQMVKCCKKHPLTLSVVGSSLNGKDEVVWKYKLKSLSQGHSVLDLNQEVLNRLERSFEDLENGFKQCYLDFGLFPEDKPIRARVLLDMWVHLYNHDEEGIDTLAKIYELSYRNLVDMTKRLWGYSHEIDDCCKHQHVTQHDLLRQLSINLNSKLPIAKRPRLIISAQNDVLMTNVQGEDHITSIEQMQEPMQARILSISTGKSFSSRWHYLRVPEVEVMVMNISSETYTLPPFLKEMQKLKILNVTNYGFYWTKVVDFHLLGCLSNLTRIRFQCVVIPSFSRSTLALVNLQKVSFIWCDMANAFEEPNIDDLNVWPRLVNIEMDNCFNFKVYPRILYSSVYLRKLSITNCFELSEISEEFGNLTSLEALNICGCLNLKRLPESITRLQKLSIIDVSSCVSLKKLPEQMGSLGGLRTIYMSGRTTQIYGLPPSVKDLSNTKVVCNEKLARLWKEFPNVEVNIVEEEEIIF